MIQKISILFFTCILLISCEKSEDDWKDKRNELIGTWEGKVSFTKRTLEREIIEQGTKNIKVRFLNDSEALISEVLFLNFENTFVTQWFYQPDPERIIFPKNSNFSTFPNEFKILEKERNTQIWTGDYRTRLFDPQTMISTVIEVTEIWEMTKQ